MSKTNIKTLTVQFSLPLRPNQIAQWRGAVAEAAGWEQDLFHNHAALEVVPPEPETLSGSEGETLVQARATLQDRYQYRLPLIYYRVQDRKATIFAMGQGVDALRRWLLTRDSAFQIGGRTVDLLIEGMQEKIHPLGLQTEMRCYRLMDYLPLNQDNYAQWRKEKALRARVALLDRCLAGHLVNFAHGIDWRIPGRFEAELVTIREMRAVRHHGIQHLAFNLLVQTNLVLPPQIALGRGTAFGFGVLTPTQEQAG